MTPQTGLYKMLKQELTTLGYWRNRSRGNPSKGYQAMQDKLNSNHLEFDLEQQAMSGSLIQPKNKGGFSTKVDPHAPETKTVRCCMRDPLELRNKFYRVNGVSGSNCPSCGIFFEFGNSSHRC